MTHYDIYFIPLSLQGHVLSNSKLLEDNKPLWNFCILLAPIVQNLGGNWKLQNGFYFLRSRTCWSYQKPDDTGFQESLGAWKGFGVSISGSIGALKLQFSVTANFFRLPLKIKWVLHGTKIKVLNRLILKTNFNISFEVNYYLFEMRKEINFSPL